MECQSCQCHNVDGQAFCGACGAKLVGQTPPPSIPETPLRCAACDAIMPAEALFCGLCGHNLSQVASTAPYAETQAESNEQTSSSAVGVDVDVIKEFDNPVDSVNIGTNRDEPQVVRAEARSPGGSIREMVYVPAGWFAMGSKSGEGNKDEQPQHQVELSAFFIDKAPISNIEYEQFAPGHRRLRSEESADNDSPVVFVSHQECLEYCRWRTEKEGLTDERYTLPSEAQWEKSARGGFEKRIYPWGNEIDPDVINTRESQRAQTVPVTSGTPNGFGLFIGSNVREWCLDVYLENYYSTRDATSPDPTGPRSAMFTTINVVRGASFQDLASDLSRCAARIYAHPNSSSNDIGFRCVRIA